MTETATGRSQPTPGSPWRSRAVLIVSGLAAASAHPPWGFLPGLLGYAGLLWGLDRVTARRPLRSAFLRGWLVGVGYFALSLHWMIFPFFVDAKDQAWMAPIAVVATVTFMALFWGAAGLIYRAWWTSGPARPLLLAGALAAAEWTRGHLLTGFPWDLPGESWAAGSPISQAASVVGAYGLTWLTISIGGAFAPNRNPRWPPPARAAIAAITLATVWLAGEIRLSHSPLTSRAALSARIVQPDVSEASLEDPAQFAGILRRYVALTRSPYRRRPSDIVVWPEGAISAPLEDYLAPQTWTRTAVLESLAPGQTLLLGGYRWAGQGGEKAYNSLAVVRPPVAGGAGSPIIGLYDKYRLVPFGEFIPLDDLAARLGIKQLVHVGGGFAAGPPPRPLRVAGLPPFQPLICYEALFPGFTRDGARRAGERPAFLVNVSTDAWFGPGAGPLQHFNLARYRSIEEGLPMLRATPTGVSAVVDAFGRVPRGAAMGLGATGIIDAALPPALGPTLYDRLGDAPFAAMLILSLLAGGRPLWPRRP